MAVGSGGRCAKAMVFLFNIIFWLTGCALLGIGVWVLVDKGIFDILEFAQLDKDDKLINYGAYLMIAIGGFVFFVGLFGCCGAIRESKVCLSIYILFLIIILLAELAAGIFLLVFNETILALVGMGLTSKLHEDDYVTLPEPDKNLTYTFIGRTMDQVQVRFECCGINGDRDYILSNYSNNAKTFKQKVNGFVEFPWTCCKMTADAKAITSSLGNLPPPKYEDVVDANKCMNKDASSFHTKGCQESLQGFLKQNMFLVIGVCLGIACIEIFGLIFAICLCMNTSPDKE